MSLRIFSVDTMCVNKQEVTVMFVFYSFLKCEDIQKLLKTYLNQSKEKINKSLKKRFELHIV